MTRFETLGDPHLGKTFIHGVPLHRRGERERMVWEDFERSVYGASSKYHINMGDLFDSSTVPYRVVLRAAHIYMSAANLNPNTIYVILQGNHDVNRDLERFSAFDVFAEIVSDVPNILVIREPLLLDEILFVPYDPVTPAEELLEPGAEIAMGHWDTIFGDHNLVPTKKAAELGIGKLYTGHVHKRDQFVRDGVEVIQVGSMQPFTHGEGDMYVTLTLAEAKERDDLRDKCVRIILEPGETYDLELDCLQLQIERTGVDESQDVTLGDFNMKELFAQAFKQAGVGPEIRDQLLTKYDEKKIAE